MGSAVSITARTDTFVLSDLPSATEFNMFQKYKIYGVAVSVRAPGTSADLPTGGKWILHYVPNLNAFSTPVLISDIQQISGYKRMEVSAMSAARFYISPKVLVPSYITVGTPTFTAGPASRWIAITDKDVPHWGMSMIMQYVTAAGSTVFGSNVNAKVTFHYYVKFLGIQ